MHVTDGALVSGLASEGGGKHQLPDTRRPPRLLTFLLSPRGELVTVPACHRLRLVSSLKELAVAQLLLTGCKRWTAWVIFLNEDMGSAFKQ